MVSLWPLLLVLHPSHLCSGLPMPGPPVGKAQQAGPPGLVPRLGRTLTCEEGQGSRVDNAELGPGVIPPPLEEGRVDMKGWRWLTGNMVQRSRQRGGQLGAEGTASTHRDFHVVGALVVLFVQHLEVVAAGSCQAGGRDSTGLPPSTAHAPSLPPCPWSLRPAAECLGQNPHRHLLTGQPQFSPPMRWDNNSTNLPEHSGSHVK